MSALVELQALRFNYPDGTSALTDVSFSIEAGERVALLGAAGSGKSTLLQHLNGLLSPEAGEVRVVGVPVNGDSLRDVRRKIGLVFQDPNDQLFLPTVIEDVAFAPLNDGVTPHDAAHRATAVLEELGLVGLERRPAHHLSGGERRLAALATVLVSRPALLVLDEPTGDLDAESRARLVKLLRRRSETLLLATHDLPVAHALCDRAVVLRQGAVVFDGPLSDLAEDSDALERFGLHAPLEDDAG
jgi:cobalt/nickel transport system ATP-binding protein